MIFTYTDIDLNDFFIEIKKPENLQELEGDDSWYAECIVTIITKPEARDKYDGIMLDCKFSEQIRNIYKKIKYNECEAKFLGDKIKKSTFKTKIRTQLSLHNK